ncbi:hypothetical protein C8Q79DRAFT_381243 [Trametes meyenii]|nr:hypothetical protein C8Q79DRAFT_381243 [Trametes meyenii]
MRAMSRDLYTLDAEYYRELFVARAVSLAGYAILVHECILTLPDEVKHIWPARWSAVKVLYVLNRYGNLVSIALANAQLLGIWWEASPSFCFHSTLVLSFVQLMAYALIHVLVLLRAWATWGRQRKMLAVLVTLFSIYALVSTTMLTYGIIDGGGVCALHTPCMGYGAMDIQLRSVDSYPLSNITRTCIGVLPAHSWLLWVPSFVLECATFTLTMISIRQFNLHRHFREHSTIVQVICRDAIVYFLVTLFSNAFNILVWAWHADSPLNMLSNQFTLCLMIVASQRLVLDLRKVTEHDGLSTTRVGREVERAMDALPRSRTPSPILFVERSLDTPPGMPGRMIDGSPVDVGRSLDCERAMLAASQSETERATGALEQRALGEGVGEHRTSSLI